jgi:hypothetical protein
MKCARQYGDEVILVKLEGAVPRNLANPAINSAASASTWGSTCEAVAGAMQ